MKFSSYEKQQKLFENWRRYVKENEEETEEPVDAAPVEEPVPAEPEPEEEPAVTALAAIENTDPGRMQGHLDQRDPNHEKSAGSVFTETVSLEKLKSLEWIPIEDSVYSKFTNNVQPAAAATAFVAELPGILGIASTSQLPDDQEVIFQPAHMGTIKVGKDWGHSQEKVGQIVYEVLTNLNDPKSGLQREMSHTSLIVGKKGPVVWTMFPGPPTPPASGKFPKGHPKAGQNTPRVITGTDLKQEGSRYGIVPDKVEGRFRGTVKSAKDMGYGNIKHVDKI